MREISTEADMILKLQNGVVFRKTRDSEKNRLYDVAVSLITAIEKISPSLISAKNPCEPLLVEDGACSEQGVEKVISFKKG